MKTLKKLHRDEEGLAMIEYVIILFLVALAALIAWGDLGETSEETAERRGQSISAL